jgi:replication-associated recombination protein RarA
MSGLAGDWSRLRELTGRADPPNLIVSGPAGTGKSTTLRELLSGRVTMWLRCSTDTSLRESRDRIKAAAQRRVEAGRVAWIVLEHADMLHTDAQAFLRRVIETSLGGTRFVLEVRDLAAIAEPLVSRCVLYYVPQLLPYEIAAEIRQQAPACSQEVAARLSRQCGGNVRWAILQGIGGGGGYLADGLMAPAAISTWKDLLDTMETLQRTGSSPRAWLGSADPVWERSGGADPWALLAVAAARRIS